MLCSCRLFFRRHYPINTVTFSSLDRSQRQEVGFCQIEKVLHCQNYFKFCYVLRHITAAGSNVSNMCACCIDLYLINISSVCLFVRFLLSSKLCICTCYFAFCLFTCASGGLILIASQASKFVSVNYKVCDTCNFAWL